MRGLVVAAALLALGTSAVAHAAPIVLFDETVTADIGAAAPLGIDPSRGNPNGGFGGGLLTGDIGFVAPFGREITITVTDLGTTTGTRAGSVYQVLLDGAPLGVTSPTAIDALTFSSGSFSLLVTAGFHDLGVWDFISTFQGFSSPYGGPNGGFVDEDFAQANVSVLVTEVPEPASWTLMGIGFATLSAMARRRKSARTNLKPA
jgi:hypothetical protein